MKNKITILPTGRTKVETEKGSNSIILEFENADSDATIELYRGNEFFSELNCRHLSGKASATLPAEALTGSNLHFRLKKKEGFSDFFHVVYDNGKPLSLALLSEENRVVFGNLGEENPVEAVNTYGDLKAFTNGQLSAYTYKELRERSL